MAAPALALAPMVTIAAPAAEVAACASAGVEGVATGVGKKRARDNEDGDVNL